MTYLEYELMNRNWKIATSNDRFGIKQQLDAPTLAARRSPGVVAVLRERGVLACPPALTRDGERVFEASTTACCVLPSLDDHPNEICDAFTVRLAQRALTAAMDTTIRIAVAQSPVNCDPAANGSAVRALMRRAREQRAWMIHFPEGAITGYPGTRQAKQALSVWNVDCAEAREQLARTAWRWPQNCAYR